MFLYAQAADGVLLCQYILTLITSERDRLRCRPSGIKGSHRASDAAAIWSAENITQKVKKGRKESIPDRSGRCQRMSYSDTGMGATGGICRLLPDIHAVSSGDETMHSAAATTLKHDGNIIVQNGHPLDQDRSCAHPRPRRHVPGHPRQGSLMEVWMVLQQGSTGHSGLWGQPSVRVLMLGGSAR